MMEYIFDEQEVVVQGEYELSATITIPKANTKKFPAIIFVNGSGAADRNGNIKNFNMNIYKLLSESLTKLGFVTLRYDKRGIGKSKGDAYKTGMMDLVDDVICNTKYLQSLPYIDSDKIILLGHSEGCILSTVANEKNPVSGLILISGAGICLKTVMQSQGYQISEELKTMKGLKGVLLRKLLSEKKVAASQNKLFNKVLVSKKDVMITQLRKFPARWLREHLGYTDSDMLHKLEATTCQVFAVTGYKDVQVNYEDLNNIKALNKQNISCTVVKDMDHMLREYQGQKSILNIKKQYKNDIRKPIHTKLEEELKVWCLANYREI